MNPSRVSRRTFIKGAILGAIGLSSFGQSLAATKSCAGLKDLYKTDFRMGVMIDPDIFLKDDTKLISLIEENFNALSGGNIFKWDQIHPTDAHWNWTYADEFVAFGEKHGMVLSGHPLIWSSQLPDGLFINDDGSEISREGLLARMEEHIKGVVGRYKGKVRYWDVVNEAFDDQGELVNNRWLQIIGNEYIEKAFQFAAEADSEAVLLYNDYNLWKPEKREAVVNLVENLRKKNIPVGGVGMQGHIGLDYPDLDQLEDSIRRFEGKGLSVHIAELDVDILPNVPPGTVPAYSDELDPYTDGLPDSVDKALAQRYAALFEMFLRNTNAIERVTFWGATDAHSWKNDFPVRGRTNYPLLFDREKNPKRAYHAVAGLKNQC